MVHNALKLFSFSLRNVTSLNYSRALVDEAGAHFISVLDSAQWHDVKF